MATATWNGEVIAQGDDVEIVEGNVYFRQEDVNHDLLEDSDKHTTCPWKGKASYYSIVVDGETNEDAAWYYPEPKNGAEAVTDRVAFWKGVEVQE